MPIEVKEVSKFNEGIHSSVSEIDISGESASLSLNIDPNSEYGALRGIYGDKILSAEGWQVPRYAKWDIEFFTDDLYGLIDKATLDKKLLLLHAYDKQFLLVFNFDNSKVEARLGGTATDYTLGNIGIHADLFASTDEYNTANATDRIFNVIPVMLQNNLTDTNKIKEGHVADAVKRALDSYAYTNPAIQILNGIENYFYCYRPTHLPNQEQLDKNGTLTIISNFYGDIKRPELPVDAFATGGDIDGTSTSDTQGLYLPDSGIYDSNATSFVRGNGIAQQVSFDGLDDIMTNEYSFIKLKAFKSKDSSNILGITKSAQVKLYENLSGGSSVPRNLGNISISSENSLSIEQRNKNLYIGSGDRQGTSSLWIGFINRKQLNKEHNDYYLEENKLHEMAAEVGANNFDNIVVPTLHHGLNNTNGGIAGAASLYADNAESGSNEDVYGTSIRDSSNHYRSVNGWVMQCLKNNTGSSAGDYDHYNDVKEGMIFRVNLGKAMVATAFNMNSANGKSAHEYLLALKELAKGKIKGSSDAPLADESSGQRRGGQGETLHDGDLFQVVYSSGADSDIDLAANNDVNMFRLTYVGCLFGKDEDNTSTHPSKADSDDAFCGIPAYAYAHMNDNENLVRIKTSSKSDQSFLELNNQDGISSSIVDTDGEDISISSSRTDTINLREVLGISDFEISTIAECKSTDGNGGFGGDTSNKNYYMGYGKLWVANKNEHGSLYLIDVTNWDGQNKEKGRITYEKIDLSFGRIHNTLISDDTTSYGKGLIRLEEQNASGNATREIEKGYFTGYQWSPIPEGQYISSICETYSHLPHLGDGAGGGVANGDGKWRVWVEYKKQDEVAHIRYDLFLFNFRVQPWTGTGADSGTGITSSNKTVYMFDKTPPNQECQKTTLTKVNGSTQHVYYPFDKMSLSHDGGEGKRQRLSNQSYSTNKDYGSDYFQQAKNNTVGVGEKFTNNQSVSIAGSYALKFRNPSGEHRTIYPADKRFSLFSGIVCSIPLGYNLGWYLDGYRQYIPVRHTLKPYYRKWYFTGNQSSGTGVNQIPYPDEENKESSGKKTFNAHVVSSFGKLSGDFVKHGGSLQGGRPQIFDEYWWVHEQGILLNYDNEYTMFTMHDSPVAIETYGSSTPYEVQGKPATTPGTETIELNTVDADDRVYYSDTEAGFLGSRSADGDGDDDPTNHSSVPATVGFGKFNQYRYHHAENGTKSTATDSADTGETESIGNLNTYGYGGQYFGGDNFGHYINIAQTWACNQDYLRQGPSYGDTFYDESEIPDNALGRNTGYAHARVFGWGDGATFQHNNKWGTGGIVWDGKVFEDGALSGSEPGTAEVFSKYGTGYFTYQSNYINHSTSDNNVAGYYPDTTTEISLYNGSTEIGKVSGSMWDNRRIVHCWSVTALTDSVYNVNRANRLFVEYDHRQHGLWKTPRCSFRKLDIPSSFGNNPILKNIDIISWAERNVTVPNENTDNTNDNTVMKSGYITQFALGNSNLDNEDSTSVGMVVYETKTNSYRNTTDTYAWSADVANVELAFGAHAKSAIDMLRAVYVPETVHITPNAERQFIQYTNNKIITKNLVPGLADKLDSSYNSDFARTNKISSAKPFLLTEERYTPVVLSHGGSEETEDISIWARAQFKRTDQNTNSTNSLDGEFPYYKLDKLWNYWSQASDKGFDRDSNDFNSAKYITEGWGSTAGSDKDTTYPTVYNDANDTNQFKTTVGSHTKTFFPTILEKESEVTSNTNVEFPAGTVYYKFSLLYDGFQESPLNKNAISITVNADSSMLRMKFTLPSVEFLNINKRVTHINIYRRNKETELYRLVRSVNLNSSKETWSQEEDGSFVLQFNDERRTSSYEGLNGIPESLTEITPNYRLSCQLNDFLFIGGLYHSKLEDGDHILLRSKQGRFSVFDWSNDFLDIPTKPVAMAAFANKVWVFDDNNIYKINPTGLYIEDRTEGIGILNSESVVVTDMGMFWCDRSNIYKHDGQQINQIGTSILKNHSKPEWQIGYLDAVNKSETLGITPKLAYDPINQSVYIALQGYNETFGGYRQFEGRIYSYDIKQDRWDYYECPGVQSMTTDNKGNVIMSDGFQLFNYRRDKRNPRKFSWDSKTFQFGSSNYKKSFKALKFTGDLCLWNFNNGFENQNFVSTTDEDIAYEEPDFGTGDDTHILETSVASETDDLKVYVDGILQTMRIKARNPVLGPPIANDSKGEVYKIEKYLPKFQTKGNNLDYDDSFSLDPNSCPEFLTWPSGQFDKQTLEGELSELMHIHRGMYLCFKGVDINGLTQEEIVRVRDIKYKWLTSSSGSNELDRTQALGAITVRTWRGQLGTKALNWDEIANQAPDLNPNYAVGENIEPIRTASPSFLFPRGLKGRTVKISLQNQKSFIDSFAISYRTRRFK